MPNKVFDDRAHLEETYGNYHNFGGEGAPHHLMPKPTCVTSDLVSLASFAPDVFSFTAIWLDLSTLTFWTTVCFSSDPHKC